jgi:hypothetical protein
VNDSKKQGETTVDSIKRQFEVTIVHHGAPAPIKLPVLRDESEVAALKASYENVIARAVEVPGIDAAVAPAETVPAGFRQALRALIECYRKAEADGNTLLSARAQNAVAALLGHQPQLRGDNGEAFGEPRRMATLVGMPGGRR